MEALLIVLRWLDFGSWFVAPPPSSTGPGRSDWAATSDLFPGLPPKP